MKSAPVLMAFFFSLLIGPMSPDVRAQAPVPLSPVVAPGDTALVGLDLPSGAPECRSFEIVPDTLGFGLAGTLILDFGDNSYRPSALDLKPSEPWLRIAEASGSPKSGPVAFNLFAYRLEPFRLKIGSTVGDVVWIRGSASDLNETAAIRIPRTWTSRWWLLLLPALLLTALLFGLWWLWSRRRRLEPLDQWLPAPPAWLQAAIDLRKLLEDDSRDLKKSRVFLDRLAAVTRRYLAGRYLVNAGEMTGREILAACRLKGHDSPPLRKLVLILESLDHHRYDPEPSSAIWARQQAGDLLQSIAQVRVIPRYCHVDNSLLLEAEKAWAWLVLPENLPIESTTVQGGGL
jgi:hypothetical protein